MRIAWVPMTALALSCSSGDDGSRRSPATPLPSSTTAVRADDGGIATSRDGNFALQIPALALEADATIVITEGVRSPVPSLTFGKAYDVRVTPASAAEGGSFSASVRVGWPSSLLGSTAPSAVGLASGEVAGGPILEFVSGTYTAVDDEFLGTTDHLSYFVLIDAIAYDTCACDTSGACDSDCDYCDPDCTGCTCDSSGMCDPGCGCDPDCDCSCDTSSACDSPCQCDPDCSDCACDQNGACDAGCYCDTTCPDTGGVYPYGSCSQPSDCTLGACYEGVCAGTCHQSGSSCGFAFTCTDVGLCAKTCTSETDCTGAGECCYDGLCAPESICPPPGWYCDLDYYGTGDGCDCGCGALDPDCDGFGCAPASCAAEGCQFCYDGSGSAITCG